MRFLHGFDFEKDFLARLGPFTAIAFALRFFCLLVQLDVSLKFFKIVFPCFLIFFHFGKPNNDCK